MDAKKIILDRLDSALRKRGFSPKRSALVEIAADAFGHHNSNEFLAATRRGDYDDVAATRTDSDPAVVANPRIADVRNLCTEIELPPSSLPFRRFCAYRGDHSPMSEHDDLASATAECGRDGQSYVVDRRERAVMRFRTAWRPEPLPRIVDGSQTGTLAPAMILVMRAQIEDLENRLQSEINLGPDWRRWEADLKKASHRNQEPIDDETLHRFRHAIADNHCKSSMSERYTTRRREAMFVERHLGGLLSRLDQAEGALRNAGLAPSSISRRSSEDAAEILAAIDAIASRGSGNPIPGLWEVEASRDGEIVRITFSAPDEDAAFDLARTKVAARFPIPDACMDDVESECDSFRIEPVLLPQAASLISDALAELRLPIDERFALSDSHPVRIKLLAARRAIIPEADQ